MKNKPAYGIESVDNALRLAVLLQEEGNLRVTDAARHLGVARSTAHRLLTMLVYRDFAVQDQDRRYVPGPVFQRGHTHRSAARLRRLALPHLEALVAGCGETANLQILVGDHIRFVASVESDQVLRVGNRGGRMLPAHLASGGLALLALLPETAVGALYAAPDAPRVDLPRLLTDLRKVRRQGFALNNQGTEIGVTAVGRAVRGPDGEPTAALCIAVPTARFTRERLTEWSAPYTAAITDLERELRAATAEDRALW
ncbi:IclR family transcriptional regulator [Streptomyces sp. NPDC102274]|uniref:IclR family transcriptional regulator n=1 Tax=Streptomyces sp. NPDC102274 TaxID=3366151 RepID=UPI003828E7F1